MKSASLVIFCGVSLVLHLLAGGALYFSRSHSGDDFPTDVLDLTVMPGGPSGPKASKGPQLIASKKAAVISDGAHQTNQSLPVATEAQTGAGAGGNGGGGEGDSGPLGEWSALTQKPKVLKEIKAQYTDEARAKGIEGLVVCDLILDENGKVRSVILVQGLGAGLDEAAQQALKNFEFLPAKIGDKKVAVKIRYKYRFQLQHQ
ncbi:energy transducer TonB [Bdellovibrio sp. HCB2-146]|uniref:energy transducer TonB n=1 Tax=Bdellovibrio sp. HCB2-146 TaxID=3394362 RepID=UPI0039BD71F9